MTQARCRTTDPDTSHDAAAGVNVTAGEQENLELLDVAGVQGVTNSEASEMLGRLANAISPRWRPMVRKGLCRDSGLRRPNNVSGRKEIVWIREVPIS